MLSCCFLQEVEAALQPLQVRSRLQIQEGVSSLRAAPDSQLSYLPEASAHL